MAAWGSLAPNSNPGPPGYFLNWQKFLHLSWPGLHPRSGWRLVGVVPPALWGSFGFLACPGPSWAYPGPPSGPAYLEGPSGGVAMAWGERGAARAASGHVRGSWPLFGEGGLGSGERGRCEKFLWAGEDLG